MRKALFLIPVLFAYLLVLGHNVIPHAHESHQHSAQHDHDHSGLAHSAHSDHHGHDEEPSDHDQSNPIGLSHFLAHFSHSPYTASNISISVVADQKNYKADHTVPSLIAESFFLFEFQGQAILRPPVKDDRLPSGNSPSARSLRGPPAVA
jgi:hypothetical protein